MDVSLAGFQSANDLAKQLITLATGILALSITFTKDILKDRVRVVTWPLKSAWIAYLLSVCFGIWTMMALTGMTFEVTKHPEDYKSVSYGTSISIPSSLQILAFVLGTLFLIVYGAKMLHLRAEPTDISGTTQK